MKQLLSWIAGFFSEEANGRSSSRLIMIIGAIVPLSAWTALSLWKQELQSIPQSVLVFVAMCLGLKGYQKTLETMNPSITSLKTTELSRSPGESSSTVKETTQEIKHDSE